MLNITKPFNDAIVQDVQTSYIRDRMQKQLARRELYIKAREYYDGIHNPQLTDRIKKFLDLTNDGEFNVNYCPLVVDAKADRLTVSGFSTEDGIQDEALWHWWRKNRMDRKQNIVYRVTVRDADAYILVEWDKDADIPRFHFEPADDGVEGVMVYYSDEHRDDIEFATKRWNINYGHTTGKESRLNLYFPNRTEKYFSNGDTDRGEWQPYLGGGGIKMPGALGIAGVHWWTDTGTESGEPLGVPIVHFKNNDNGDRYGTSRLHNVMPIQDALNKSVIDLIGLMDANGFPVLVGTGTTDWLSVNVGPGAISAVSAPANEADLKILPAANPDGILAAMNALVMEIGRVSGTPLSYFQVTGQVSAEGTMKQQEIALVMQVKKAQVDFGNGWEDCLAIGRRLHNAFGTGETLDTDAIIDTVWVQAESRNDKEQAETLAIRVDALGVSQDQAQVEMGYDATLRAAFVRAQIREQALSLRRQTLQTPPRVQPSSRPSVDDSLTQTESETNGATATEAA